MTDREVALANFLAATGSEDITDSIVTLERHNWILVDAISSYIPQHLRGNGGSDQNGSFPTGAVEATDEKPKPTSEDEGSRSVGSSVSWTSSYSGAVSSDGTFVSSPPRLNASTAAAAVAPDLGSRHRMLHLKIEWRDKMIPLVVRDDATIAQVKSLLEKQTHVPTVQQSLKGWPHSYIPEDTLKLSDLSLPRDVTLFLLSPPGFGIETLVSPTKVLVPAALEKVKFEVEFEGHKTVIPYLLEKTLAEFKQDMKNLFSIEPRHQEWHGFPNMHTLTDNTVLHEISLLLPVHSLRLSSLKESTETPGAGKRPTENSEKMEDMEEDSSGDMDEDDGDALFSLDGDHSFDSVSQSTPREPLLPAKSEDSPDALLHFLVQFQNRYGEIRPDFYVGSFGDALKEAFECDAMLRKPLFVYVHHDFSIQSNVFCSTVLCTLPVVQYLNDNFVTWGWDVTDKTNEEKLLEIVTKHFGSVMADTVEKFQPDQLPVILVILKSRGGLDVFTVLQGHISPDELMANLLSAYEAFQPVKEQDMKEESERAAREEIKDQQDAAYRASLETDRQKAELQEIARQEEERKKLAKEREAQSFLQQKVQEEAKLRELRSQLPAEPTADGSKKLAVLRFRYPNGSQVTRRFLAKDTLEALFMFITSQGYSKFKFRIKTNYPNREISALADSMTLEEAGLCPRETLFVEERAV